MRIDRAEGNGDVTAQVPDGPDAVAEMGEGMPELEELQLASSNAGTSATIVIWDTVGGR